MKQQPFGKGIPILTWRKPGEFFAGIPHFVENIDICAESGVLKTAPVIYTDAEELQWMEQEKLSGIVEGNGENKVRIRIYKG